MFSGGAGWAEIQRRCLCVGASVKHNKTLWGMNQTQTDRDTKAHMLIHSVNFTISLPLSPSLFHLSYLLPFLPCKLTFTLLPTAAWPIIMCFGFAGLLSSLTLAKFIVSAKCYVRLAQTGLAALFIRI